MDRGIVIGARLQMNEKGQIHTFNGSVENADLLRWLLYWDRITYAGIGFGEASITGNHPDDVKYLESVGIFQTEVVDVRSLDLTGLPPAEEDGMSIFGLAGNQTPLALAAARISLTETLAKRTGGIWAVGQAGDEKLLLPGTASNKKLIDIQLVNCLPTPAGDTPFDDILQFKEKYRSELERLRYALDALREKVLSSSDEQRATLAVIREISMSLEEVHKALHGSGVKTLTETINLYTHNPSLGFWTAIGGAVAAAQGISVELGATLGLAAPTAFRFIARSIKGAERFPSANTDFAYAFEAVRQLK